MQHPISTRTRQIDGAFPKTHHLPNWYKINDAKRLGVIREIVESYGRDPRVAETAVAIVRQAGVKPRNYRGQAEALLRWVQTNIYYINEPGERLQSPLYTLRKRFGDCDDEVILLCSFFEACRLPWKLALAGKHKGGRSLMRYVEGDPLPHGVEWTHIYCLVGDRPFTPTKWTACETTLSVPMGWDVVEEQAAGREMPPELAGVTSTAGSIIGSAVGTVKGEWEKIGAAVVIGATTAIMTELMLEFIRSTDTYLSWKKTKKKSA